MDPPFRRRKIVLERKLRSIPEQMEVSDFIELKQDTETNTDKDTYPDKDTNSEKVEDVHLPKPKKGKKVKRESVSKKEVKEEVQMNEECEQSRGESLVGYRVNIWWPIDQTFYQGEITSFLKKSNKHEVLYDNGHAAFLNLDEEIYELIEDVENVILALEAPVLDAVKRESSAEEVEPKK